MLDRHSEAYQKHVQLLDERFARQAHQIAVLVGVSDTAIAMSADRIALQNGVISRYCVMEIFFGFAADFLQSKEIR